MQIDGLLPGQAMQRSVQCMQLAGFLRATDEVITEMLPDERIKNVGVSMDDDDDNDLDGDGGVQSGLYMFKSLWKEGKYREAAAVEERSEEINNVLPQALCDHLFTV
ncbi:hypothetical protein Acr_05g0001950 [Actinidia rufa]|uniref:Uncharacterized protein n=1 Tax=Actinidia rufa TaxID=165716 RepID=A0A7J0EK26_9ERIC|nr:hypothetical protein Acr_05g0001950 [Actinidia rufa]